MATHSLSGESRGWALRVGRNGAVFPQGLELVGNVIGVDAVADVRRVGLGVLLPGLQPRGLGLGPQLGLHWLCHVLFGRAMAGAPEPQMEGSSRGVNNNNRDTASVTSGDVAISPSTSSLY